MARAGSDTDFPSGEHSELFDRPVTESVTARAGSDTDFPSDEYSEIFDRPVTESVTARAADTDEILVMNVSTVVRVSLGNVTSFWSTFVLGGGVM